ncbi:unnamed protein product, partial [marine sediment metagenome]
MKIKDQEVTRFQLFISSLLVVIALFGGWWGLTEAEDRWNQIAGCETNKTGIVDLETDMLAGFQQIYKAQDVKYSQKRIQDLYDQLVQAERDLAHDPNNQTKKNR